VEEPRIPGIGLEVLAQSVDEGVQCPGGGVEGVAPDALQQFAAGHHPTLVLGEVAQQHDLPFGEVDGPRKRLGAHSAEVDHEGSDLELRASLDRRVRPGGAPQDALDAELELLDHEGLRQIIVGAEAEPQDSIGIGTPGGEEQNRDRVATVAEPTTHLEAVDAGQHDVQHDEIESVGPRFDGLQSPLSRVHGLDLETVQGQRLAQTVGEVWIVLDQQESGGLSVQHLPIVATTARTVRSGIPPARR
jgi:hypothetical protein